MVGFVGGIAIGGFVVFVVLVFIVSTYNTLLILRREIDKAWSNIDVLLKQRRNEITKLVDIAKDYGDYEESVLEEVIEKRRGAGASSGTGERIESEKQLGDALENFFDHIEEHPELKEDESFMHVQERISEIENRLSGRKEFYNSSVRSYNTRINQIPYNMLASFMGYTEKELFEVDEG